MRAESKERGDGHSCQQLINGVVVRIKEGGQWGGGSLILDHNVVNFAFDTMKCMIIE